MTKMATCKYWVASRQRYCKFDVGKDSDDYCPIHNTGSGEKERIPCPIDPKHMIFKKDVERHIPKCSKALEDIFTARQPFTNRGCNLAPSCGEAAVPIDDTYVDETEMTFWREKLAGAKPKLADLIRARMPSFTLSDEAVSFQQRWSASVEECVTEMTDGTWDTRMEIDKHNLQNACLLEVLKTHQLAPSPEKPRLYVELGCGKAGLTRWLIYSMEGGISEPTESPVFLLLDYEARRYKQENKKDLLSKISASSVVRLRSNILDVDLSQFLAKKSVDEIPAVVGKVGSSAYRLSELEAKVASIQARPTWPLPEVVGIAKHLCGAATDFGLRCLHRVREHKVALSFATCCHHRCDWDQLVGKDALAALGVCQSATEFRRMISMAGWATTIGIAEKKRTLGRLVKAVIDLSRVHWIVNNFDNIKTVEYSKYIEDGITPENFCIVFR